MAARWVQCVGFTVSTILIGVVLAVSPAGPFLERQFGLSWLFSLRGPVDAPDDVAVIGINSTSGADMGLSRLPRFWPRSMHAVLVDRLKASGVPTVVFDMDFNQAKVPVEDQTFAEAIERHGGVVLFERLEGRNERLVTSKGAERWLWVETALPPAEPMASAARAVAPFPLPKIDKSSFQFWAFKPSADDAPTTASVAVQLAMLDHHQAWRHALERAGIATAQIPPASALKEQGALRDYMQAMRKLFLGKPFLADAVRDAAASGLSPEDQHAVDILAALYSGPDERYTNYYGPPGSIRTIAYQDTGAGSDLGLATLPDEVKANEVTKTLDGRTVFVGYSDLYSADQPDRFYTVFTSDRGIDLSGCEIMATSFANLLTDATIRPAPAALALGIVILFGIVISQLVFWPSAYVGVPLTLAASAAYAMGAAEIFGQRDLWLPMATPLAIQLPYAIVAGLLGQYLVERRQKQRVGAAMAAYLPQHLVKDLTEGRLDEATLNQVVHGICLANDMSGFSNIAEKKSPAELATFMNAYFEIIAKALKSCEVDVTEFHADTIMCAFLGDPGDPEPKRRAIRAALSVVRAIEEFSAADPDVTLSARVGLQDGHFYLGHTGGGGRLSYSILGNPANSASRLEGLNKKLGTRILAAKSVAEGIDDFTIRPLGDFKVVGKDEVVSVVEIVGPAEEHASEEDALLAGFAAGLDAFCAQQWDKAKAAFEGLSTSFPQDKPSAFYLDVCRTYLTEGPPEQPTRLAMTSK